MPDVTLGPLPGLVLAIGAVSAVLGVLYALMRDLIGGQTKVAAAGATLAQVINDADARCRRQHRAGTGRLRGDGHTGDGRGPLTPETPLEHHRRHPRSFLDVAGSPDSTALTVRFWCIECHEEIELGEDEAEELADQGVPWRTGTE